MNLPLTPITASHEPTPHPYRSFTWTYPSPLSQLHLNDLDNETLWRLWAFVSAAKKPKPKPSEGRAQQIKRAMANSTAKLQNLRAGSQHLGGVGGGTGGAVGGGGSPSDSGSDIGSYLPESNVWDDFHESKQQYDQQQQQQALDSAGRAREQAGAVQREREAERAAERASREQGGDVDLSDQSNVMASFQVPSVPRASL